MWLRKSVMSGIPALPALLSRSWRYTSTLIRRELSGSLILFFTSKVTKKGIMSVDILLPRYHGQILLPIAGPRCVWPACRVARTAWWTSTAPYWGSIMCGRLGGGLWGSRRTQSGWEGDRFLEHLQADFTHAGNGISARQNGRRKLFVLAACQNFFIAKLSGCSYDWVRGPFPVNFYSRTGNVKVILIRKQGIFYLTECEWFVLYPRI